MFKATAIAFTVSMAVLILALSPYVVYELSLELDESPGLDMGYGVCLYGDILYVVGSASGRMSIVAVSAVNGSRFFSWTSPWGGELYDCVSVDGVLYVVGVIVGNNTSRWFIGVFSSDLRLLSWRVSYERAAALSIDYSDGFLYIAGFRMVGTVNGFDDVGWVIERVDKGNLSSYISVSSNPSSGGDIASAIAFNRARRTVWTAGLNASRRMWRIEVYDENLRPAGYRDVDLANYPYFIGFDNEGYCYIAGTTGVVKLDENLNKVAEIEVNGDIRKAVIYNGTHLVLFFQRTDQKGVNRVFMSILDKHLNKLLETCITCDREAHVYIDRGRVSVDGSTVYIAGYGRTAVRYQLDTYIAVYSIEIPTNLPIAAPRETPIGGHYDHLLVLLPIASVVLLIFAAYIIRTRGKRSIADLKRSKIRKHSRRR